MNMKNVIFLCLFSAAIFSCSDQGGFLADGNSNQIVFHVDDFVDATQTRTNCNPSEKYKITWADGDVIGVFPYEGDQEPFTIPASQVGQTKASFDGGYWALKDGKRYNAYYPFSRDNYESSEAKTKIPVTYLGQSQNGKECNVGAFDYTYSDWTTSVGGQTVNFAFHHIGAFLVIDLPIPATSTYDSLTVSTNSDVIPVSGTYDLTATSPSFVANTSENVSSLTLALKNCHLEGEKNATFYMMMPPVNLENNKLEVVLKASDGTSCTYSIPSINIAKGKLYKLTGKPTVCNVNGTTYQWLIDNGFVDSKNIYNVTTTTSIRLWKLLPSSLRGNIKSLKVSGPLNPNDITVLRSLSALEILDMSDASIIEGTGNYYSGGGTEPYWGDKLEAKTTKKDVFPELFMMDSQLKNLHTLYLPNSVKTIPRFSLWGAQSVKSITLGTGLKRIEILAFDCGINSITIPKGVEFCGTATFEKCHDLVSINVEEGNRTYTSIDGVLYEGKIYDNKRIYYLALKEWPANKPFNGIVLPNNAKINEIYGRAFGDCKFTEFVIPEGVNRVGGDVFCRCKNLHSVTIPTTLTYGNVNWFVELDGALKEIHMKATTPPSWYFSTTDDGLDNAVIYVPKGTYLDYYRDSNWYKIKDKIKEEGE